MAVRLGSAYGQVNIDASGVVEGTEQAGLSVSGLGDTIKSVFTFAAGQIVAKGFQALTGGMMGLAGDAIESASTLQDLGLAMETLVAREIATTQDIPLTEAMDSAGAAAEALLGDLQELAIVSPFEYQTVSDVLRVQMAFGATSETAMDLTRAILNTGAALGQSGEQLDRMNFNLAQALVMGDLTGGNLRQLKMAGLDLAGVLEGELSMSIEEVRDALEDGSLTMEEVSGAFVRYTDQNFGNAAERMSKTFSGLKSSIGDLFFFAGADLVTPALEVVTEVLGELFDDANEIVRSGVLKDIGEQLGESLKNGVAWLKEEAIPQLVEFGEVFRRVTLPRIRQFVSSGLNWLQERGQAIWGWMSDVAIPRLREWGRAFVAILPQIREFVSNGINWVLEKGREAWMWISSVAIPTLREWAAIFRSDIMPAIRDFVGQALDGLRSLYEIFQAGGLGGLLREMGSNIAEAARAMVQGVDWKAVGKTIIDSLGDGLKAAASQIARAAQPFLDRFEQFIESYDWNRLGRIILERIGVGMQAAYDAIRTWVIDMVDQLRQAIQDVDWEAVARTLLMQIGTGIEGGAEIFNQWATRFVNWLGQSLSQVDWVTVGQSILDGIEGAFVSVKKWMDETGAGLGIGLGLKVAGGLGLIAGPAGIAAGGLLLVTNHLDEIKEAIAGVVDTVREKMPTAMEGFEDIGTFWAEHGPGISESINRVFGRAIELIGELASKIIPWAIDKFAQIGAWLVDNGPLIEDFVGKLADAAVFLLDKVAGLWGIIQPILDFAVNAILGYAKLLMQIITGDWGGAWDTAKEMFMQAWEDIKGIFRGAVDWVLSFLDTDWAAVSQVWQDNWEMLKIIVDEYFLKPLQDAISGVTDIIDGVITDVQNLIKTFEDLTGIELPDWLTPGSPTPFEIGLRGIADAVRGMPDLAMGMGLGGMPALAPAMAGADGGGGAGPALGGGGGGGPVVNFYGPVTIPGVTDGPSFLEELTRMADGR